MDTPLITSKDPISAKKNPHKKTVLPRFSYKGIYVLGKVSVCLPRWTGEVIMA